MLVGGAVGVVVSAGTVSAFSPMAIVAASSVSLSVTGSGFPVGSSVAVKIVSAPMCNGASSLMAVSSGTLLSDGTGGYSISVTSGTSLTFQVNANSAAGVLGTVCVAFSGVGVGGGSGPATYMTVGGANGLRVASVVSVSPRGMVVPVAVGASLTVSGINLTANDAVVLTPMSVGCGGARSSSDVGTSFWSIDGPAQTLVVTTSIVCSVWWSTVCCVCAIERRRAVVQFERKCQLFLCSCDEQCFSISVFLGAEQPDAAVYDCWIWSEYCGCVLWCWVEHVMCPEQCACLCEFFCSHCERCWHCGHRVWDSDRWTGFPHLCRAWWQLKHERICGGWSDDIRCGSV